tara:strand:+ start:637 stop:1125 length:489 start_codon:yes stop_codon:yes gene_type:complete
MAIPGHEFLTAHFSNNEKTTVESYWVTPDGKETRVEYIEAKEGDPNWENLLTHIDIDELHEATYKQIRAQNEAFEDDVIRIAKERGMVYDFDEQNTDVYKAFVQVIFGEFDPERDKEKLFLFKLQLFEADAVKSSKSSAKKKKLRQAKTMIDATKAALSMIE